MREILPYKEPTIVRGKKDWFVVYHYQLPDDPLTFKRFEVRDGINYVHDLAMREIEVQKLRNDVLRRLQEGYNPFLEKQTMQAKAIKVATQDPEPITPVANAWTMEFILTRFIAYCKWKNLADRTVSTYQTFVNNIEAWLITSERLSFPARQFTESMALEFLDEYFDQEEWTPRTYNNHVAFFTTLFNRSLKLEKKENDRSVQYNIELSEIEEKSDRAEKNRYYADVVAEKVKNEVKKYSSLYLYIKWIYYSCMRPREIRLLQIQHIDLNSRQIKAIGPTAKTGDRFVPISDELLALIMELKLDELNPEWYVFGNSGKPGPLKYGRDDYSNVWRTIREKLGLDDKYTLYGWKHTRVVNLLMAGFTDAEVMSLTGHRDYESFKAYKRNLIIDATVMQGKTIDF